MPSIEGALLDFKRLDQLATGDTAIHHLDPRAKVLVTLVFIVSVISFGRYELTAMAPFFIFPVVMVALGNLPPLYIVKKIMLLCPFVLMVGVFNPIFDRTILVQFGPIGISGGWISFASIIARSALTVSVALILVGLTGFPAICWALERLGMPQAFAVQLVFLYRYIFVLTDEGARMARARELRSFGVKGLGMKAYGPLLGHLLLRTWSRAERIHMAMLTRGFTGEFHTRNEFRFGKREILFLLGWTAVFALLRLNNCSQLCGALFIRILP
ncbi:MAG TPA: cobalt ECF transporter T component CbiQ [Desulfuromonadaceae bacterium]|jgi:cobalt/nickel transport system permease protein